MAHQKKHYRSKKGQKKFIHSQKELVFTQKGSLIRKVALVIPSTDSKRLDKLRYTLIAGLDKLNDSLRNEINNISRIGSMVRKIQIESTSPPIMRGSSQINSIDNVIQIITPKHDIRVIINLYDSLKIEDGKLLKTYKISHLFEVNIYNDPTKEISTPKSIISRVVAESPADVFLEIENICLDIAMYYSYIDDIVFMENQSNADLTTNFSLIKAAWLKENYSDLYKSHELENMPFITLSKCFRANRKLNYEWYVNAWKSIRHLLLRKDINVSSLDQQLKNHKYFKILPLKKLNSIFSSIAPGEYLVIRTKKKPAKPAQKISILRLIRTSPQKTSLEKNKKNRQLLAAKEDLKLSMWRTGLVNILPKSYYSQVSMYKAFLSIYKITKQ